MVNAECPGYIGYGDALVALKFVGRIPRQIPH